MRVTDATERAWMVAYLPHGTVDPADALKRLHELIAKAPVAEVELFGLSTD